MGIESLTDGDSFELFCEHAFGGVDNIPDQLDQTVVSYPTCRPLAIAAVVAAPKPTRTKIVNKLIPIHSNVPVGRFHNRVWRVCF